MDDGISLGGYSAIVTQKNGEFIFLIPDLSIMAQGESLEEAYQNIIIKKQEALAKYSKIEEAPPPPRHVTLPLFAYKAVFIAMIIALTTAVVTTINVTVASYGKYSPKTLLSEIDQIKNTSFKELQSTLLDAIETQGLKQEGLVNVALGKETAQSSFETGYPDSHGGVDGVKNGGFGFATDDQSLPWWEVDLGTPHHIHIIKVYNQICCPDQALPLVIQFSQDHETWDTVFENKNEIFGGNEGNPLRAILDGQPARWVRLMRQARGHLKLDEVEVYGKPLR